MLSRIVVLAAVVLAIPNAIAPEAPNQNILPNGGFEDDANGDGVPDRWTYDAAGSDPVCTAVWSTDAYTGARSYGFTANTGSNCFAYSDLISAVPGAEYTATAWTKSDSYGSGVPVLKLEFFNTLGDVLNVPTCVGQWPYGGGWNQARYVCVAPPLTSTVRVGLEGSFLNHPGSFALFDTVIVRAV